MKFQDHGQQPKEKRADPPREEAHLIRQAQEGSHQAFEGLLRLHERKVFTLLHSFLRRRQDVEDLAQEVFLKAYLALGRFRPGAPFGPWLHRIAINTCYDHLRSLRRRGEVALADLTEREDEFIHRVTEKGTASAGGEGGDRIVARDLAERILMTLSPQDRMAITLREVHGFDVAEIAQALGCTRPAAKVRLFRARRAMQTAFQRMIRQEERKVNPPSRREEHDVS